MPDPAHGAARDASERRRAAYRHGHLAEAAALLLLLAKGFRPLARRYKTPLGEIDLIVKRGRTIAFVEVKARALERDALESVGRNRSGASPTPPTSGSPGTRPQAARSPLRHGRHAAVAAAAASPRRLPARLHEGLVIAFALPPV